MAGMMSSGMICGADEIGLASESDGGIMILENMWDSQLLESRIGESLFDLTLLFPGINGKDHEYTLRDTTFEIDNILFSWGRRQVSTAPSLRYDIRDR